jgi:hypothetical protein
MTTSTEYSSSLAQSPRIDAEVDNVIDTTLALNRIVGAVLVIAHHGEIGYHARSQAREGRFADFTKRVEPQRKSKTINREWTRRQAGQIQPQINADIRRWILPERAPRFWHP